MIVILTRKDCLECKRLKDEYKDKGVEYIEVDLESDIAAGVMAMAAYMGKIPRGENTLPIVLEDITGEDLINMGLK